MCVCACIYIYIYIYEHIYILDLFLTNAELIGEVKIGGSLGCSDQVVVEFMVSRDICQAKSIVKTIKLRKATVALL